MYCMFFILYVLFKTIACFYDVWAQYHQVVDAPFKPNNTSAIVTCKRTANRWRYKTAWRRFTILSLADYWRKVLLDDSKSSSITVCLMSTREVRKAASSTTFALLYLNFANRHWIALCRLPYSEITEYILAPISAATIVPSKKWCSDSF